MRYLPGVIEEILDEIPETEGQLRAELTLIKDRLRYTVPEAMGPHWVACAVILARRANDPNLQWARNVHAIWNYPERN